MAYVIREIPTLTGVDAQIFAEQATLAERRKGTVDFSAQRSAGRAILKKAKQKLDVLSGRQLHFNSGHPRDIGSMP